MVTVLPGAYNEGSKVVMGTPFAVIVVDEAGITASVKVAVNGG
jgi:hypothetical protein